MTPPQSAFGWHYTIRFVSISALRWSKGGGGGGDENVLIIGECVSAKVVAVPAELINIPTRGIYTKHVTAGTVSFASLSVGRFRRYVLRTTLDCSSVYVFVYMSVAGLRIGMLTMPNVGQYSADEQTEWPVALC